MYQDGPSIDFPTVTSPKNVKFGLRESLGYHEWSNWVGSMKIIVCMLLQKWEAAQPAASSCDDPSRQLRNNRIHMNGSGRAPLPDVLYYVLCMSGLSSFLRNVRYKQSPFWQCLLSRMWKALVTNRNTATVCTSWRTYSHYTCCVVPTVYVVCPNHSNYSTFSYRITEGVSIYFILLLTGFWSCSVFSWADERTPCPFNIISPNPSIRS